MAARILSWNAGAFEGHTAEQVARGVTQAVIFLEGEAKQLVSTPGPEPSAPGEPPHRQIGNLRADISHEAATIDGATVRGAIGVIEGSVAAPYARRLELGFVGVDSLGRHYDQAPRPFLRPAVLRNREKVVELIASA
jgi:hypothetical protein